MEPRPLFKSRRWAWLVALALPLGCAKNSSSTSTDGTTTEGVSCSYDDAIASAHCGCNAIPPVDITMQNPPFQVWPFGVHAQSGHTEGHRGLDFIAKVPDTMTLEVPVVAPVDGMVVNIDNSQDQSGGLAREYDLTDPAVHFTKIKADCGLTVVFIPLRLDDGIVAGVRVQKGQRLGTLPLNKTSESGTHEYSSHFEFDTYPVPDQAYYAVCAAQLFSDGNAAAIQTLTTNSSYPEASARTLPILCDDGSTKMFSYAAENMNCNPRLSKDEHDALAACLPSRAPMIW